MEGLGGFPETYSVSLYQVSSQIPAFQPVKTVFGFFEGAKIHYFLIPQDFSVFFNRLPYLFGLISL